MNWPSQRLDAPDPARYSEPQRQVHDAIANGPRGGVRGPLAVWLHRPELAAKAQDLGRYCRYDTLLPPRLSELLILVTARVWTAEYEWQAHKRHALAAGLDPEIVEAVRRGVRPDFQREDEEVVHDFARAAHLRRRVDDALYERAVAILGADAVVDMVGLLGYYSLISLTITLFRIPPIGDAAPELGPETGDE